MRAMDIAIIGTGFIGGTLGRAFAAAGEHVVFGSRHPESDALKDEPGVAVTSVAEALAAAEIVVLALPGQAVAELVADHGDAIRGKLVVDATNQMGQPVANCRAALPDDVRYARAFNTLGGENFADPVFADGPADLFFSTPEPDRETVETLICDVGLRPIFVGSDQEQIIDALFRLWIALAMGQGRGRRLAQRLLDR
jgi:8-hydroxy-5-deazaflavin:NADPH oxidoreductase